MRRRTTSKRVVGSWILAMGVAVAASGSEADGPASIAPEVLAQIADGAADFIVVLSEQADLRAAGTFRSKHDRGRFVFERLRETAQRSQAPLVEWLSSQGVEHRSFWVANMLRVHGDRALAESLARRGDVARVVADTRLGRAELLETPALAADRNLNGIEWHVSIVGAPSVWARGVRGAGAVVGSMDTGFEWTHPALVEQYRGNDRGIPDHDYDWHDAIHAGGGPCGDDSLEPCDEDGHGTLTMGIAVGDDGAGNQIGIAPEAKWIGCRCWEPFRRTHLSYVSECFQWFLAPTTVGGADPDPAQAPDVVYNSWICEPDEGCPDPLVLKPIVENLRAAGIVVVASAGNSGDLCSTIEHPPAIYDLALTVGATTNQDAMAGFSSRGPVVSDGSGRIKPDVVAPGQNLRTSQLGGSYTGAFSGTSFSGPLVAGVVALMISAVPALAGDVDTIEQILLAAAEPILDFEICGGVPASARPNNVTGYGRVDAFAAYLGALRTAIEDPEPIPDTAPAYAFRLLAAHPNPFNPSVRVEYEIPLQTHVSLTVFDTSGRSVRQLVTREPRTAGRHAAAWDGRDDFGGALASGVYFLRLEANTRLYDTLRLTLVR